MEDENNYAIQVSDITKKFGNLTAVDSVNLGIKKEKYSHCSGQMEQARQLL
jgi:ABC-type branched-subunit amino acid transport system ATPase component